MTRIEYIAKEYPRDTEGLMMQVNTIEDKKFEKQLLGLRGRLGKSTQELITQIQSGWQWNRIDEVFERVLRTATSNAIECDINGVGYGRFWFHIEKFVKDNTSFKKFEKDYFVPTAEQKIAELPEMWRTRLVMRLSNDIFHRFEEVLHQGVIPAWYFDPDTVRRISLLSRKAFEAFEKEEIVLFLESKEREIIRRELDGINLNKTSDAHKRAWEIYRDNPVMSKRAVARKVVDEFFPTLDKVDKKRKVDSIRKELEKKFPRRTKKTGRRDMIRPEPTSRLAYPKSKSME